MDFNANKAIYLQIAAYVCDHILLGTWKVEDKLPSVRELAVQLEVNPNTVMRTYDLLQQKEIVVNKRGVGFFVTGTSVENVKAYRKAVFLEEDLNPFFRNIYLLEISLDELKQRYQSFIEQNFKNNEL
ncbi:MULTISPECIES: GntR family transcriptional regulator [Sphingobacterium]|jgi:GntR family transcriptional regulator|uniref:GntR family transcriptional regulator n=1 Tax=Sphingobacterium TaxID=28453 RepID=UPI0004E5FF4D|nr:MULTISPECIES: GntR family transcriptional regulator [Sphingobacterium]CDT15121.1 putative transcriptional regulator [Sphingobacterium sp. PM2-P1-29]SJN48475.1 Transcriptional regulator, GntR family [Sphingobacterium faecium PCAi_F2.5]HCU46336.1 GntR family transcriptional regulator [Sphingobacterium sp.]UXD68019.1 GntR family transcriptional regulator [Sphingobacterium faecium]WGQ15726.1 GntR family transcriptional regulator [Sphingobacterium faecium]